MAKNVSKVYKVNHLVDKNTIKNIFVFFGNNLDIPNPNELFIKDQKNVIFNDIFNEKELLKINENKTNVFFSKQQIHFDDSIGTIKTKILIEFKNIFSFEEIYLFCLKDENFNSTNIFQTLTQNNLLDLTKIRLNQFLKNIYNDSNGKPINFNIQEEKETYDYDDILQLKINNIDIQVTKSLGQKFFIVSNDYQFICNPFDVTEYDIFIERSAIKSVTTLNNNLLLNTGNIIDNNIYLCLADDVLKRAKEIDIS